MSDELTPEPDLQAEFDAARLAGDHARMAEIGPRLYPEPAEPQPPREGPSWGDDFAEKLAAKYPATISREGGAPGPLSSPRAVIAAINAELEKNRGHQLESRRQALLRQRDEAYQQDFEASERAATAARVEPAAPPVAGYTAGAHPAPPPGRAWNAPALDAVAAQLVAREIAPADFSRWLARGAALAQEEPGEAPTLDPAVIADARFALQAFFPERSLRAHVDEFLEETGLGNDQAFIRELATRGAPLRRELEQTTVDRSRLATLNQGSREYQEILTSIHTRFRRIFGGA